MAILKSSNRFQLKLKGTSRIEAFSDSIFAFSLTILVMNIKLPQMSAITDTQALNLLAAQIPQFVSFLISFLTICILWVNHHHFYGNFDTNNWKILWLNNFLLFWIILLPFATDFLGSHPELKISTFIYSFVMLMASVSFWFLTRYVFIKSDLMEKQVPDHILKKESRLPLPAIIAYSLCCIFSLLSPLLVQVLLIIVPIIYFVPSAIEQNAIEQDRN